MIKSLFVPPKNKKGVISIILFFLMLFTVLILGFIAAVSFGIIDFASETITPIMTDLGVVGDSNISSVAENTFGTMNTLVNSMPWLIVFAYAAMLIFTIAFVVSWNVNPNPVFIGIYFVFVLLLIFGAIVMSNMYEDLRTGGDIIAVGLQDQAALSFMILHSPLIFALIAMIVGIYIFAGKQMENQGGFGV